MLEHKLMIRHGFPAIALEAQHCSQAVALANGYPAELETFGESARAALSEGPRRNRADAADGPPAQAA